jgi:hypothetical protein
MNVLKQQNFESTENIMFGLSKTNATPSQHQSRRAGAGSMLRTMVRFCNFYGEYQSIAPSDRRRFVIEQEPRS